MRYAATGRLRYSAARQGSVKSLSVAELASNLIDHREALHYARGDRSYCREKVPARLYRSETKFLLPALERKRKNGTWPLSGHSDRFQYSRLDYGNSQIKARKSSVNALTLRWNYPLADRLVSYLRLSSRDCDLRPCVIIFQLSPFRWKGSRIFYQFQTQNRSF